MTGALAADLCELNMAASDLWRGMVGPATFSLLSAAFRPAGRPDGHGLEDCLTFLRALSLRRGRACQARGHPRLQRTRPRRVPPAALHRRGVGSPGGTDRIRGRAAVGVTAPIAEAQLVETVLLNQLAREGDRPRATSRVFRAPDAHREARGVHVWDSGA